jgi:apolipoprotein N-acyltransferase
MTVAGHPAAISICYEDVFGEETIEGLPEAAFLVNASNDAWFGDSLAPLQHLEIARMRSLETGRYLLRSTNTGISALIGPKGEILKESPAFEQHVLQGEVRPMTGLTPYARVGNWGVVSSALLAVLVISVSRSRRNRKRTGDDR